MFLKWILVYLLMMLTGNPLLVLLLFLLFYGALDWRYFGFFPRFTRWFRRGFEIRDLERKISLNPNDAPARVALGRAYYLNGEASRAIPQLQAAFQKMKDTPEVHYYLGLSYLETGKENDGVERLLETIRIDPRFQYGEPYLKLGEYYLRIRDFEKALERLERFCTIHTSSSEGFYQLAMAQLALGDRENAAKNLKKSIEAYRISPSYKKQIDRKWRWKAVRSLATL